jgi:hypothetical protein
MITHMAGLASWRGLLLGAAAAVCLTQLVSWTRSADRDAAHYQPDCAGWDRAASDGIAMLISDTSAAAELRLDEAILQLRRARRSCRSGATALARHDYVSLHRAFPVSTGSIRANKDSARGETGAPALDFGSSR